jgi:glutamyl-tRNA synthetase
MRRGCVIEALRKFIISQGPSKNINNLEWASFWAENKKIIDPVAKRFTAITKENRYGCCRSDFSVLVTLDGVETHVKQLPCHKKNPDVGTKKIYYSNEIYIEQEDALTFKENEEVFPWRPC